MRRGSRSLHFGFGEAPTLRLAPANSRLRLGVFIHERNIALHNSS
jgi:hypothetical protein